MPNRCPVCGKAITLDPSTNFGDAPCPNCGVLLWFFTRGNNVYFLDDESSRSFRSSIREAIARQIGVPVSRIPEQLENMDLSDLGADSLDTIELIMELEEEFDIDFGDDDDGPGFPPFGIA